MEAETVNVGTKFIIRDIAEQVGDHVEKLFSWDQGWDLKLFSWDQDWDAGTKGKGVGVALSEEVHTEGTLSHLYRAVLLGLCLPSGQLPCFFFHTWLMVGPSSGVCMHLWAKMDFLRCDLPRWEEQDPLWPGVIPWLLTPRTLPAHVYCLPYLVLWRAFASLWPCYTYSLEVLKRERNLLSTLFVLLLLFPRANMGLIVNSSVATPLSLISGNAKRGLADYKCLIWSLSISCLIAMRHSLESWIALQNGPSINTIYHLSHVRCWGWGAG